MDETRPYSLDDLTVRALEVEREMVLKYQTALAKAEQERDEARRERDHARVVLQEATDSAFDSGAKAAGLEESHRFVAMRKERDEARAVLRMAREALGLMLKCWTDCPTPGHAEGHSVIARIDEVLK